MAARSPRSGLRHGTWSPAPSSRRDRAPRRCTPTASTWRTASTPPRTAVTRDSPGWSARPWATRRAGRTTRNSRSAASIAESRLPGVADVTGDTARGLRLRDPAGDVLLQPGLWAGGAAARVHQRGPLGTWRGAVPGRRRLIPAIPDQPRGGARDRVSASRAVRRERRSRAGDDAADVLHRGQRRRQVRPRHRQARRQGVPLQPVAVSDRLTLLPVYRRTREGLRGNRRYSTCLL